MPGRYNGRGFRPSPVGITGIEYKSKKAKDVKHGWNVTEPIEHGKRGYEGAVTLMQSELIALNQAARAKGYKDILDVDFDIIVTYEADLVVTADKICCASLSELPSGTKEGDAQAEISLPFVALDVEYDTTALV
ncbi:MAG: hypothetical protein V8S95_03930 [Odoribacter sp.]